MKTLRDVVRPGAVLLLAMLGLAGCGRPDATTSRAERPAAASMPDARVEAEALAAQGEWDRALPRYREALQKAPSDVVLRYGLGVSLSHVGRRDEAIEQFRWVAHQDAAGRGEVRAAREWLARVGVRPDPVSRTPAPEPEAAVAPGEPRGRVRGGTSWPGVSPETRPMRLQMLLEGDDSFTRGRRVWSRTQLGDDYAFNNVYPGAYRLVAQVGAMRLWETRVKVEVDRETVLDLSRALSPVSPAHFPLPADR